MVNYIAKQCLTLASNVLTFKIINPNKLYKKSPQIVGLGPPMYPQIYFCLVNFNAKRLNILLHLPLL